MAKWVCDVCGYVYDPEVGDPDNGVALWHTYHLALHPRALCHVLWH